MELRIGQTCGIADRIGTYLGQDEQGRHLVKYQTQSGQESMETIHAVPYKPIPVDTSLIGRYVIVKDMQCYAQITDLDVWRTAELNVVAVLECSQSYMYPVVHRRLDELEILDYNPFLPKDEIKKQIEEYENAQKALQDKLHELQKRCMHEWETVQVEDEDIAENKYKKTIVCRICRASDAIIKLKSS